MDQALEILRMVLGAVYVLFLPGFVLSFVFFRRGAIDIIERLALSFALSIAVVPLVAFYLNLVGVKISFWSVVLEVLGIITIAGLLAWRLKRWQIPSPSLRASGNERGNLLDSSDDNDRRASQQDARDDMRSKPRPKRIRRL